MEPMILDANQYPELLELATELISKSHTLTAKLHPVVIHSLGDIVRSMNCYYSNLIEGHDTHPRDIDRALANHFSSNSKKRALQLEAKAHIEVQRKIDFDEVPFNVGIEYLLWIHQAFYRNLPEELMWVVNPDTEERIAVEPGKLRQHWVQVGRHIPPAPEELNVFL